MFAGDVGSADRQPDALSPERPGNTEGGAGVSALDLGRLSPFGLDTSCLGKAHGPVTVVVDSDEERAAAKEETTNKRKNAAARHPATKNFGRNGVGQRTNFYTAELSLRPNI